MKRLSALPGTRGRLMRALACGVGAVLLVGATLLEVNDGAVISFSVVPTSGQAHVVIGIDGPVSVRDFALRNPDRIVIDITGASLGVKKGGYDRVARGGVLDVRYAQNQPNVVRVVLTLAGPKRYDVSREAHQVMVSVEGGDNFRAWRVGKPALASPALAKGPTYPDTARMGGMSTSDRATVTNVSATQAGAAQNPPQAQQPRISVTWDQASIREVLGHFAAISGRTIIPSREVDGTITAEIVNQPWDVAMRAILRANGFDAYEDENGIIIVNTRASMTQRPRFEPLITRTVRLNYTAATDVANALRERLTRDCGEQIGGAQGQPAANQAAAGAAAAAQAAPLLAQPGTVDLRCPQRGAVTADPLSNSVSITDVASSMADMIEYARTLDVRQPQVNIKAKIILVDRTQLEALGLKYDLGTREQYFNRIVPRADTGALAGADNVILLGGNAISAIANAGANVPNATLSIIYSAAIGAFDFTTFMDALTTNSLLDVQAEPSVTTLSGRRAILTAGTQVPVLVPAPLTGGTASGAAPQVAIDMRQTGIVLEVTPSVTNNRQIMMTVHAENSDVQLVGGSIGAIFPTQAIDNVVLVADGETAVMGGLTQTSVTISKTGIPFLVDLPLIGRLFGVTTRNETKRDLLILITPHIVDDGDTMLEPRRSP
ncbi:MAG: AMIN domain-containing protein [Gemmatimonadaceae bacterium]